MSSATTDWHGLPLINGSQESIVIVEAVIWTCFALSTVFLAIRLYARIHTFQRLYWDDAWVIWAWVLSFVMTVVSQLFMPDMFTVNYVAGGYEYPGDDYLEIITSALQSSTSIVVLYYSTIWAVKISFLLFFYRIQQHIVQRNVFWWSIFVTVILTYLGSLAIMEWVCEVAPVLQIMSTCVQPSLIAESYISLKVSCFFDVFSDFLILLIPIKMVWGIPMRPRRKITLIIVAGLVIVTMMVAIVRTALISTLQAADDFPFVILFSYIEVMFSILVACLGSFRSLFVNKDSKAQPVSVPRASRNIFLRGRSRLRPSIPATSIGPNEPGSVTESSSAEKNPSVSTTSEMQQGEEGCNKENWNSDNHV